MLFPQECMVDGEGKFNELAGPELQNLSVMGEGTDKGTNSVCETIESMHMCV